MYAQRKERYKDAPFFTRLVCVYARRHWVLVLILFVLLMIKQIWSANKDNLTEMAKALYFATMRESSIGNIFVDEYPTDEEGTKYVDSLPKAGKDDTWTICVYMIGSNLEDCDENDLSDYMCYVSDKLKAENKQAMREKLLDQNVSQFDEEIGKNGLELPAYLSRINIPKESDNSSESTGNERAMTTGSASADISQMTSEKWSDNIQIVIQPGGATRWGNEMINPNRTQRFLYKNGAIKEIEDLAYQPASDPDTLSDFLAYCKDNYPADHQMLILWDHGSGAFGFGHDSITNGSFNLTDIRSALSKVYSPNMDDPAFDIIGFDACLMSSIEVTHALYGFADYYALSEETEPADGWDYQPWLKAMSEDPTLSPAKIASLIADANVNLYIRENAALKITGTSWNTTFAAIDARAAEQLYDAYGELTKAQLMDATKDISVMARIGQSCDSVERMASDAYNVFNTVDLGNYARQMKKDYPNECEKIEKLIEKAVIYHRENGIMDETNGISVYIPGAVNDFSGLYYFLDYVYDVCDQDSTRALYYYKVAGCVNDEMAEYVESLGCQKPKTLDVSIFRDFSKADPAVDQSGFTIQVKDEVKQQTQDARLEIAYYDEEFDSVINYGADNCAHIDEAGRIRSDFDGKWICLDGQPLAVEAISTRENGADYRSRILYNDKDAWLMYSYDKETDSYTITGIRLVPEEGLITDTLNYMVNTKTNVMPVGGDTIVPVYDADSRDFLIGSFRLDNDTTREKGETVTFSNKTAIRRDKLKDGYYLTNALIEDQRCDSYYSETVGFTVNNGQVTDAKTDASFVEYGY
ncbi:MAG: hypothetical protein K6E75_04415 [Lachnospiraceae bacterium]|nr:hypothetical protein [Lachnospiraceae bacterium]